MNSELKQLKKIVQELNELREIVPKYMKLIKEAESAGDEEKLAEYSQTYKEMREKFKELKSRHEMLKDSLYDFSCETKTDEELENDS